MDDLVLIRQYVPGDEGYVYSNWLRDLRDADPSGLPDELWFPPHRAWIDRLLADPDVTVLIAAAADQPNEILGFIVARPHEVLEWVHVRRDLRKKGLARRLLTAADCPPGTPARWSTPQSRERLRNPNRSRLLRSNRPPRRP